MIKTTADERITISKNEALLPAFMVFNQLRTETLSHKDQSRHIIEKKDKPKNDFFSAGRKDQD